MSVIQAVLLGILGGLGIWDSRVMGLCMMERPLFLGPVVGLILGDFQTGIVVGASLELVMMGIVGIGSATIPDTVSASILATAFAITSGLDVSAAVALARRLVLYCLFPPCIFRRIAWVYSDRCVCG